MFEVNFEIIVQCLLCVITCTVFWYTSYIFNGSLSCVDSLLILLWLEIINNEHIAFFRVYVWLINWFFHFVWRMRLGDLSFFAFRHDVQFSVEFLNLLIRIWCRIWADLVLKMCSWVIIAWYIVDSFSWFINFITKVTKVIIDKLLIKHFWIWSVMVIATLSSLILIFSSTIFVLLNYLPRHIWCWNLAFVSQIPI